MRREKAEALRDRLQREDRDHEYLLRAQGDEWEVVRIDLPSRVPNLTAERGAPANAPEDVRPSLIRNVPPYGPPGL